jgi:predicted dehydrogenase
MTLTLDETARLYEFAEPRQRLLCVGHSLLYMDCVQKALGLIRSGRVGRVVAAHCFFGHAEKQKTIPYRGVSHWAYRLPGGPLINLVSHPASVLVELLGQPGKLVYLTQPRNMMPYGFSDLLDVAFMTDAGVGTFTISMAHGNASRYLNIECEKGSIYIDLARQLITVRVPRGKLSVLSKVFGGIGQGWALIVGTIGVTCRVLLGRLKRNPGTRELVRRFYLAARSGGQSPITRDNALGVADIVNQVQIAGEAAGPVARRSAAVVA